MNPQHETEQDEKRLKELRKRRDDHTLNQAEKRELDELEGKEEKHASGKNLKEPKEPELTAEEKAAEKAVALVPAPDWARLARTARQLFIDHITKLGGVGAPLGPMGDRIMAWLKDWDTTTLPITAAAEAKEKADKAAEKDADKDEDDKDDKPEPKPFKFK
jgi:hypothetical protein